MVMPRGQLQEWSTLRCAVNKSRHYFRLTWLTCEPYAALKSANEFG
jgi:hypothetical protein